MFSKFSIIAELNFRFARCWWYLIILYIVVDVPSNILMCGNTIRWISGCVYFFLLYCLLLLMLARVDVYFPTSMLFTGWILSLLQIHESHHIPTDFIFKSQFNFSTLKHIFHRTRCNKK